MAYVAEHLATQLAMTRQFFEKTISCLEEADSGFAPRPEMFTSAQQVAHAAQIVDWFIDAAFGSEKFRHDYDVMETEVRAVTSLAAARKWLERAFAQAEEKLRRAGDSGVAETLKDPSIIGPSPKGAIVAGIVDHTAHHRGALTVYARLMNKVPAMPYA